MNTANKLTMSRMILGIIILIGLLIPWNDFGISIPTFLVMGKVLVDIRYPIAGFIFVIACVTDYLDGSIARRDDCETDFGAMLDAIADKILVNGLLIILAYQGFISIVIPIIIVLRDTAVDSLRMLASKNNIVIKASKWGKWKTACMMIGLSLTLFYNLPFEVWGLYVSDIFIDVATILSIISAYLYFVYNRTKLMKIAK